MNIPDVISEILHLARWAPSGDNTQPWRFEILGENRFVVHGYDTREHCVYDLDGHPSQMALGALLENISIAATEHGLRASCTRRQHLPDTTPTFDITLESVQIDADPLVTSIQRRTVQRRAMPMHPLTAEQKSSMESAAGESYRVVWLADIGARFQVARLMFANAKLRLTIPEAYEVHRSIIDWNKTFSEDKVPDKALGVDPATLRLMRWLMEDWKRVEFFNKWLAGTVAPRIQLDFIPGIACAAHFVILAASPPQTIDDYVAAGRAMQRLWLTATHLGLFVQPEMTPLIFSRYVRENRGFTATPQAESYARSLYARLQRIIGEGQAEYAVFMGRIGAGSTPKARSVRLPLDRLLIASSGQ